MGLHLWYILLTLTSVKEAIVDTDTFTFEFETFPFPITHPEVMRIGDDALYLRFFFKDALTHKVRVAIREIVAEWWNEIFEAERANYYEEPLGFRKERLHIYIDTRGNDASLEPFISDLVRRLGNSLLWTVSR